jgi:hypothetical protein
LARAWLVCARGGGTPGGRWRLVPPARMFGQPGRAWRLLWRRVLRVLLMVSAAAPFVVVAVIVVL